MVKYNPVAGKDEIIKAGTSTDVNVNIHCITCMKEYESKSLEELRLEDYVAGRKGPSGVFGTNSCGVGANKSTTGRLRNSDLPPTQRYGYPRSRKLLELSRHNFGGLPQPTGTAICRYGSEDQSTQLIGNMGSIKIYHTTTTHCTTCMKKYGSKSLEELRLEDYVAGRKGHSGVFGTYIFGQPATTSAPSLFGFTISSTPAFGQTDTSSFGGGTQTNTQAGGLFGANKPAFGATPTAGTGLFAATTTQAPAFGTNTSTFGFGANTQNQTGGLFKNKPATSGFGTTPSTGFGGFGARLFAKTNTTTPTFGTTTPAFGTTGFGTNTTGSNLFGNNTFGKPPTSQPSLCFNTQPALEENNRLESELHEREKELHKLQTNSEMLMHEYQKLKNQQGIDSEVLQKVMQQAGEWYKQNKRLQRKCNALMLALPSGVELDLDATDAAPDTSSNEEVEFLKRTLSEMREHLASIQTDANADNVHMLEQTKEIQQLRNRLERHNRVSKLLVEMSELENNADESIQMTEIKKLTILELDQQAALPRDTVEELQLKKAEKHEDTVILSWEKKIKLVEEDAQKALERAERAEKKLEELQQRHAENRTPRKPYLMSIINNFETGDEKKEIRIEPAPLQEPTPPSPPPSPLVLDPPPAPPLPPPPAVFQSSSAEDMAAMLANKGASLKKTKEDAL